MAEASNIPTVTLDGDGEGEPVRDKPGAFDGGWAETSRYALVSEIGRGGGGRVAVAVDRKLGRKVALKRPLDPDGSARLEREAAVLARLQHPSIVPIHDAGRDREGSPFYTMKLVTGDTLAARIAGASSFAARLALLRVVTAVADAMAYAHAQGVVHRDLKPGNVVVGSYGEVAVIDWGLGKLVDEPDDAGDPSVASAAKDLTGHGYLVGTPAYMAPEQARSPVVDRRADVYALGAMLYHVLAGVLPYGDADDDTVARLLAAPPPAVDLHEPRVPAELAAIVGKAMARDPAARYATAAELADDLRRYQDGRLVAAHRYSPWARAWRWLRRYQGRVAIAVGAVALASAGAVWASAGEAGEATCAGVDAPTHAAWNPQIAATVERAFAATHVPAAAATWRVVSAELDKRTADIAAMRVSACRAAHVVGDQTVAALDLRMTCLDRRTDELRTLATTFAAADRATVEHALDGLATLGRVDDCADVDRLRDVMPLPSDPVRRETIAAIDSELTAVIQRAQLGRYTEAATALPAIAKRAEATGYEPLRARALFDHAEILLLQTKTDETLALIHDAITAAERAGDDRLRADARLLELHVRLNTLQDVDAAARLVDQIRAIADRVHDRTITASALGYLSQLDYRRSRLDDAVRDAEQALASTDPDSRAGRNARYRLGSMYGATHRYADGERVLTELIASLHAVDGNADDPSLAAALENLGAAYSSDGQSDRARAALTEAAGIYDRTLPPDAKARMEVHTSLAVLHQQAGHLAEARAELDALLPIAEHKLGHDHQAVAAIVFRIAENEQLQGHRDAAIERYRDALARFDAAKLPLWVAKCHLHVGSLLLQVDDARGALAELQPAYDAMVQLRGADSPEAAIALGDLGRAHLGLGDAPRAVDEMQRALAVLEPGDDLVDRGLYHTHLAMARSGASATSPPRSRSRPRPTPSSSRPVPRGRATWPTSSRGSATGSSSAPVRVQVEVEAPHPAVDLHAILAEHARDRRDVSLVLRQQRDKLIAKTVASHGRWPLRADGLGQIRHVDRPLAGERGGRGQRALELADVVRPVVVVKRARHGGRERDPLAGSRDQRADHEAEVVAPLAQRRQLDREAEHARVEIVAERAPVDHVAQIAVGGGAEPHVDRLHAGVADREHLALLQHAEQRRLRARAQLGDLVEEQRAAVGAAHEPGAIGGRARERAALGAEQLGFDERLRQRTAVDRDERPAALGQRVQRAGDDLLAGAGLADHHHRHVAGRDACQARVRLREIAGERRELRRGCRERVGVEIGWAGYRGCEQEHEEGVAELEEIAVAEHAAPREQPVQDAAVLRARIVEVPRVVLAHEPAVVARHPRIGHAHDERGSAPLRRWLAAAELDLVEAGEHEPRGRPIGAVAMQRQHELRDRRERGGRGLAPAERDARDRRCHRCSIGPPVGVGC